MFFIDVANPWILLLVLFLTLCFIYIGKEAKNAYVALVPLIAFLVLIVMHVIQYLLTNQYFTIGPSIARCISIDFVMIFISYIAYLWIDDIETKAKNKKSIDDSLEWFWKKV